MVEAIPTNGIVSRKCGRCGKYFENQQWDGNYLCPACREGWEIDKQEEEDVPAEALCLAA